MIKTNSNFLLAAGMGVAVMIGIGILLIAFPQTDEAPPTDTDETILNELPVRTAVDIYQDLLDSQKRTDSIMREWHDIVLHSDDDLTNTINMLEDEKKIQGDLYEEYASLSNLDNTDEQIREKFATYTHDGWFYDANLIDNLKYQKEAERDITITLEHNGCDNTCPVYSVMINGDGSVLYKGLKNVKDIGKQEYEISADTITELNKFFTEEYKHEYGSQDDAKSTTIITIDFGRPQRIVNHDNSGPESLKQFEEKIKEIAVIKQFVQAGNQFTLSDSFKETIREKVDDGTHRSLFVGIIDENGVEQYYYGHTGENEKPIDENTVFETGSISKVFTSVILADMVESGDVGLDDPIDKFLPENVKTPSYGEKRITLLDLATHTSGLPVMPNYPPNPDLDKEYEYSKDGMYGYLGDFEITREIGSQYEYSNTGGSLLGHVLSLHSGKSYEMVLKERILDKLAMDSTCIHQCDEIRDRFAKPHGVFGELVDEVGLDEDMASAGGIRSSAKDMLVFLSHAMNLDDSELQESFMLTQIPNHQVNEFLSIGLGWHILQQDERTIVWHNGATEGFASFIGFDSGSKEGVVVLTNSQVLVDEIGWDILNVRLE